MNKHGTVDYIVYCKVGNNCNLCNARLRLTLTIIKTMYFLLIILLSKGFDKCKVFRLISSKI